MSHPLHIKAILFPHQPDEHYLSARDITKRLSQTLPHAHVDWQKGNEWIELQMAGLRNLQAPATVLESQESYRGQVAYLALSYPESSGQIVWTYLDGEAISLQSQPGHDVRLLIRAAREISQTIDYGFRLEAAVEKTGFRVRAYEGTDRDPLVAARMHTPHIAKERISVHALDDWSATLKSAVAQWLSAEQMKQFREAVLEGFESEQQYASAVVADIASISAVRSGWSIAIERMPRYNGLALDQDNWMTVVELNGVSINL